MTWFRRMKLTIRKALNKDRRARATKVGQTACELLGQGKIREAFGEIKGWYKDTGPKPSTPSRDELEAARLEYQTLYQAEAPTEAPFPVHVDKYDIEDGPPMEEEVVECLSRLRNHRAAEASGITAEMVKGWHCNARPLEDHVIPLLSTVLLWEKVLELIKLAFVDGVIPQAFTHSIMVLIPKDNPGEYRGIALLEIIAKLRSSIINRRISSKVIFDDALPGFELTGGRQRAY